jgi:hypothetical protein
MVLFEKVCGRAGTIGCENNRIFPKGVAREFSYEVRLSPADRPLAYTRWLRFLAAFCTAVNKRDRVALRGMIASPFHSQDPGEISSPDEVIRWLDRSKFWQELQREAAPGARFTFWFDMGRGRPTRCSKDGIFCFELGSDGRWRLAEQGENETGN